MITKTMDVALLISIFIGFVLNLISRDWLSAIWCFVALVTTARLLITTNYEKP